MAVYKISSRKVEGQPGFLYLYLYKLDNGMRQAKLRALQIKLPARYWNEQKQRVSRELPKKHLQQFQLFKSVDQLNKWLNDKREDFIKTNGSFEFIANDDKTLNHWCEKVIERTINQGTKLRYKNIYNLLIKYQLWHSIEIQKRKEETPLIYFKDITVDWISTFTSWLQQYNGNAKNSANYKTKGVKTMINKAHNERWYVFNPNPFSLVKMRWEETTAEILTVEELRRLADTDYIEVKRTRIKNRWGESIPEGVSERNKKNTRYVAKHTLTDISRYWQFQLYGQGIRVSDLITLRWNNFKLDDQKLRIHKRMIKTKKHISILVNSKMTDIIGEYIFRYTKLFNGESSYKSTYDYLSAELQEVKKKWRNINSQEFTIKKSALSQDDWKDIQEKLKRSGRGDISISLNRIMEIKSNDDFFDFQGNIVDIINKAIGEKKEAILEYINKLAEHKFEIIKEMIIILSESQEYKNDFVFTLLDNAFFEDINENNDFGYLKEHQYRKFQSARTYYNNLLKLVAVQANIKKSLCTHSARHSYTSLMLQLGDNVNLYDLMESLGHSNLKTTQGYIQKFTHKKVDNLNLIISDKMRAEII